jgi:hypothetical protein
VDPLAGLRADGPGADDGAPVGVGEQAEVPARVVLIGPWSGDRLREIHLGTDGLDPLLLRLLAGEADGGDLRVGEDHPRDAVVPGGALVAGDVVDDDAGHVHRDVGERHDASDVTQRPHAVAGPATFLHDDLAALAETWPSAWSKNACSSSRVNARRDGSLSASWTCTALFHSCTTCTGCVPKRSSHSVGQA